MNFSNVTGSGSFQKVLVYTNDAVGGILMSGGIIVFFFIILMSLIRRGEFFENALAVASWSMFLVSAVLWFAKLVPVQLPISFAIVGAFDLLYLYARPR